MEDKKTDLSNTPLSDDPVIPTKGLSAKLNTASHPAGAEPALDTLFHRTSLRLIASHRAIHSGFLARARSSLISASTGTPEFSSA